jgi:hypothetical protein
VNKTCITCKKTKPIEEFGVAKQAKDGHNGKCLECLRIYDRKRKKKIKHIVGKTKKCYKCKKTKSVKKFGICNAALDGRYSYCKLCKSIIGSGVAQTLWRRFSNYKSCAKQRGLEFNVDKEKFREITDKPCRYCGKYSNGEDVCGIDRVDSNKGYIEGNMVPCCSICNSMKNSLTQEEFIGHIRHIYKKTKKL